ncbi:MAG TPA: hypothetical protein VGI58_19325 [Streptosporangiaceae bacterium]
MTSLDSAHEAPASGTRDVPPSGRTRVYLHIGEPKTGTTFLQQAMWANRSRLARHGIVLPGQVHRDHFRASRDLRDIKKLPSDPADPWVGDWDVLTGEALSAPHAAVISDELLAACTAPQVERGARTLAAADLHVVCTVRDFGSLLPAEWQETIKCRATMGWEDWLDGIIGLESAPDRTARSLFWRMHDTLSALRMWSQYVAPDHVHVIALPRDRSGDALWVRFASVLGIDPGELDLSGVRPNASLGLPEIEFLRRMNQSLPEDLPYWFYSEKIKGDLAHDVLSARPGQARLVLPPDREAWAKEQAELVVAGVREAGYQVTGDLSELLPEPAARGYVAPADIPADQMLDAAVRAAVTLTSRQFASRYPGTRSSQPWRLPPREMLTRLEWKVLNGPRTRRLLHQNSNLAAVRRLRVAIWRILNHPGRARP